jgi:hypothetical protein
MSIVASILLWKISLASISHCEKELSLPLIYGIPTTHKVLLP